ncbi:MAG TPA: sulfatase-like hydrolase/transferase [Anaerolineales bacterium]|nr:sulfatase-like hydrolase/transferase [Anaerolineales bacterium]
MNRLKFIRGKLDRWFAVPWYPLAISAYPVLTLLASNAGQVGLDAGVRPLLASLLFGGLLFFLHWIFFRRVHKAAFLAALWLALFFSYGHAYIYIDEKYPDTNFTLLLAVGWGILFLLTLFWATRPKLTFISATGTLNVVALALLLMAGWQILSETPPRSVHALALPDAPVQPDLVRPDNPPDVYLFVLDSYGRADLFQDAYGFDNSEFLDGLEERGFYIAECSQSNYVRTEISLASSLNLQYLQELSDKFSPDSTSRRLLWDSLKHNAVRYNFQNMGYETVTFETGFEWLNIEDSDHFLSPPPISSGMTEFEGLFLRTTLARYAQDWGWVDPDYLLGVGFRDRFNNVFNNIDDIARMPQPTFTYLHLISPHPPFVFDPNGNPTYPPDFWNDQRMYPADLYQKGYVNQLQFLNKKLLQAVDTILAESDVPPIIIMQGDHGPWLQPRDKRMWILAALHLPGHNDKLYPTISPVNFFRLVFNSYFGGKYELLEDVSYFSPVPKLYNFSEVPNSCGK